MTCRRWLCRLVGIVALICFFCCTILLLALPLCASARQAAKENDARVAQLKMMVMATSAHLEKGLIVAPVGTGLMGVDQLLVDASFHWRKRHPGKFLKRIRVTKIEYTIQEGKEGEFEL